MHSSLYGLLAEIIKATFNKPTGTHIGNQRNFFFAMVFKPPLHKMTANQLLWVGQELRQCSLSVLIIGAYIPSPSKSNTALIFSITGKH